MWVFQQFDHMINPMSKVYSWVNRNLSHSAFTYILINNVIQILDPPFNRLLKFLLMIKTWIIFNKRLVHFIKLLVFLSTTFRHKLWKFDRLKRRVSILVVNSIPCERVVKVRTDENSGVLSCYFKLLEKLLCLWDNDLDDWDLRTHETRKKR